MPTLCVRKNLLLDAFVGVPGALEFADVDDLADVIGVVRGDVGDAVGPLVELGVVGGFDEVFHFGEDGVEFGGGRSFRCFSVCCRA